MSENKNTIILFILLTLQLFPQEYSTGILLDPELYKDAKKQVLLTRGDFEQLPVEYSIFKYTPAAASQGSHSTCAGWAVAYYGRTILEAIKYNWDSEFINLNTFSPSFVYNIIRADSGCERGVSLLDAVKVLKDYGSLKMSRLGYDCSQNIGRHEITAAERYKIKDFRILFTRDDLNKTMIVKKSISENKPVIIAIDCPASLYTAGEFWQLSPDEKFTGGGHALTVVAYDNNLRGGSFQVLNSWGDNWGKNGTCWISYKDFQQICCYGFDLIDPVPDRNYDLSGELKFIEENGKKMHANFNGRHFVMHNAYPSGTKFQLYLNSSSSAYIYAFSTDLQKSTFKIFPSDNNYSALLPYRTNNIAIPDEYHFNILDEVPGKSYYIFLYSKDELNIEDLMKERERSSDSVYDLLVRYFGDPGKMNHTFKGGETIKFHSDEESRVIFLLVEFKHI